MWKSLGWGAACAALLLVFGCSGSDPANEGVTESAAALGEESIADTSARLETALVSLADGTIHQLSMSGADLGIFARGLSSPTGLALDRHGNVYVADVRDSTIRAFSTSGADLGVFASPSTGLNEPFDLTFDHQGDLLVSNIGDNTIRRFSATGQPLGIVLSLLGRGCPAGLAVDHSGNLLVADVCVSAVRKLSPTGQELAMFATNGLSNPQALVFDDAGNLFVANTAGAFANTIHEFSPSGQHLTAFGSTGLNFPSALAFDRRGELLVANEMPRPGSLDYSIRKFSTQGKDLGDLILLPTQPVRMVVRSAAASTCTQHPKRPPHSDRR